MSKYRFTTEEFINTWIEAYDKNERMLYIAIKLNTGVSYISQYSRILRELGVELPDLRHSPKNDIDVDKLNKQIKEKMSGTK